MPQTANNTSTIRATLPIAKNFPAVPANRFLSRENQSICLFTER